MFSNIYKGKKVLITGHTGFKGCWLTLWLLKLGAEVIGVSKDIPTKPSMFEELKVKDKIKNYKFNITDLKKINEVISSEKPDFLFHLAAQSIVSLSYIDPIQTIQSNVIGTTNVVEALRNSNHHCTAILVTSDKAYDNIEQPWGYKENDYLGGKDIYSGSKGAAEFILKSYYHSFFKLDSSNLCFAIARAGNVIGGGDWAKDRITVDCFLAWSKNKKVKVRNPEATRPWQHVLEPLSGYLTLCHHLYKEKNLNGEAFNFGPNENQNYNVRNLIENLSNYWNFKSPLDAYETLFQKEFHEANLLKLNCDKALYYLKWYANLNFKDTVRLTGEWYSTFYKNSDKILDLTFDQIDEYETKARKKGLAWTT